MKRYQFLLMLLGMGILMNSCMHVQDLSRAQPHNLQGGYYETCDELPGLLGDDC